MPAFDTLVLAFAACLPIHLLAMAAAGVAFGVSLEALAFGFGPTILRAGRLRVGLVPLGGYVRFADASDGRALAPGEPLPFDRRPLAQRLAIVLAGVLALVSVAFATLGGAGLAAFAAGFGQIVVGALSPFGAAPAMLHDGVQFAARQPFAAVFGLVAAKFAALQLLPYPGSNGGAVVAMTGSRLGLARFWSSSLRGVLGLAVLALGVSWAVALATFVLVR